MLVVLDTCNLSVAKHPSGGFVLNMTNIEGAPQGMSIMLPVEGKDTSYELIDGIVEVLGPRVATADLQSMKSEVKNAGLGDISA